ncbi:hypothetical protein K0M31_019749 [Melipona bicolor]|uniref:Uncharacterized protein n=1 Tax=Melipona bicolor TaxID=60889 RepID=A0AA40KRI3_9HYME|nr:hypothetical protein K0M31_019749 [Melipona bicolor]
MAVDAANLASLLKRGYDACYGTNDEPPYPPNHAAKETGVPCAGWHPCRGPSCRVSDYELCFRCLCLQRGISEGETPGVPGDVTGEYGSDFARVPLSLVLNRVERNFFQILDRTAGPRICQVPSPP